MYELPWDSVAYTGTILEQYIWIFNCIFKYILIYPNFTFRCTLKKNNNNYNINYHHKLNV